MRRLYPLRITTVFGKLVYVIGIWLLFGRVMAALLNVGWVGLDSPGYGLYVLVTQLAAYLVGARLFRGRGEYPVPPRPWWQMTARPKLSRRLGILFIITSAFDVLLIVGDVVHWGHRAPAPVNDVLGLIGDGVLAYLYLNSARRLKEAAAKVASVVALEPFSGLRTL